MRLIYGILLFILISACSRPSEFNETSALQITDTIRASATAVKIETLEPAATISPITTLEPEDGEKITLMTSDGVQLAAVFYAPEYLDQETDILVLVHEAYRERSSWDEFRSAALENGYAVIALDLRGHGQSSGDPVFDLAMDHDIDAVIDWISASPDLNEDRIAVVGASVGANLALRAGARHSQIDSVVLLSPGMSYWELGIEAAILDYGQRPLLLVAAEGDTYPAKSVQRLNELGRGYDKLVIYPGAAHGTQLIRKQPDLTPLMFDWFEQTVD